MKRDIYEKLLSWMPQVKCLYIPIDFPLPEDDWPEISLRTYYLITMNARNTKGRVKEH